MLAWVFLFCFLGLSLAGLSFSNVGYPWELRRSAKWSVAVSHHFSPEKFTLNLQSVKQNRETYIITNLRDRDTAIKGKQEETRAQEARVVKGYRASEENTEGQKANGSPFVTTTLEIYVRCHPRNIRLPWRIVTPRLLRVFFVSESSEYCDDTCNIRYQCMINLLYHF